MGMKKIIFVCTGNTCRSPMAEKLAIKFASQQSLNIEVVSRGILIDFERSAHPNAMQVMESYGLSLRDHIATEFNIMECTPETTVLTMTKQHKVQLETQFPIIKDKIYTLKEFAGYAGDILDPYGRPLNVYQACAQELEALIRKILY